MPTINQLVRKGRDLQNQRLSLLRLRVALSVVGFVPVFTQLLQKNQTLLFVKFVR